MMKSDVMKSLKATNLKVSFSISPLTKWILTILVLGIGIAVVVFFYTQEQSQNAKLRDQVDTAATSLVQNSLTKRDLDAKLSAANLKLAKLQVQVPSSGETMTMQEALYRAASDADVEMATVNVSDTKATKVGDSSYQAFTVSVTVNGPMENQLRFAGVLGSWLPSADITSSSTTAESMSLIMQVYAR